jgi:hypothetical protein
MRDIRDCDEAEMRELYPEYLAGIGRPVPQATHRLDKALRGAQIQNDVPDSNGLTSGDVCGNVGHTRLEAALVEYGELKGEELA